MFDLPPPRHISTLRTLLLPAHLGEGRFTQSTAAVQTWRPELVFMPPMPTFTIGTLSWEPKAAIVRSKFGTVDHSQK
jgi:hypothetical protein